MTGSLIRKFIQVQATNVDDWLDGEQYFLQEWSLRTGAASEDKIKKRKKINLKLESLGKSSFNLGRNKHPLFL